MKAKTAGFLIVAVSSVAGCGGGDGGGTTAFTSFSAIPDNGVTQIEGQAVTASYTANLTTGDVQVGSVAGPNASTAIVTTRNGEAVRVEISAPGSNFVYDDSRGDIAIADLGVIGLETADGRSQAVILDNEALGFEYQTFGTWVTGYGTGSGTVGAGSYGARTNSGDLPIGQSASYQGIAVGVARRSDGQPYVTASEVNVSTNFSTAGISSTGTQAVNLNTGAMVSASELDFAGSGPVNGSGFRANVSGTGTSGRADGIFYGPNASEVGGTYQLTGPGGVVHAGAFGGN